MNTFDLDQAYVAHTYGRFPVEIVSGKGARVTDSEGNVYIDMGTGIAVNTFGMCDDAWQAAVIDQLGKFQHTSNLYYTAPCAKLAEQLCRRTGMKKVFFSNSGAEANECAIKAARHYATEHHGMEKPYIITLVNSFHGRTITTLAATGQDSFHKDFQPLTDGFVYAPANDLEAVRMLTEQYDCAAVMFEPVQGEGGVMALEPDFVHGLTELAKELDLLLIADEVQTGNGRCGALYAYMRYGILPDIVTTAKGLGGGLPIGATMLGEKVQDVYTPGLHGSTFGGNPVCCAGALNILSRLTDDLMAEVRAKSDYIFSELTGAPGVKSVSGMGLMIGIETEKDAGDVLAACRENGVLVIKAKAKVRLLPPLNIPWDELQTAVAVIKEACR